MTGVHHTTETLFILVISMWGHTGSEWQYIGNQVALQQPMTEAQCEYLIDEKMWKAVYENQFYKMVTHCFPTDCAGMTRCD
jgi:hypothetical protein|tara:strand:- start:94 stop:336 length:243 start_codon:yes stop_codon:yes gene_type:complete